MRSCVGSPTVSTTSRCSIANFASVILDHEGLVVQRCGPTLHEPQQVEHRETDQRPLRPVLDQRSLIDFRSALRRGQEP
jgi:hypothetical protein